MKLLFVTPQLPWPSRQGTALRNFHLLRAAASAHEVDLLSFDREFRSPSAELPVKDGERMGGRAARQGSSPLAELCGRVVTVPAPARTAVQRARDLALGRADMERRLWSPAFAAQLAGMLQGGAYDAVQLEGFEVAGYLLGPAALRAEAVGRAPWANRSGTGRSAARGRPKLIFDDHNAEYQLQASAARIDASVPRRGAGGGGTALHRRGGYGLLPPPYWRLGRAAYSLVQARRLRAREALYCAAADATLAVSAEDAAALEAICPGTGAIVVPNGVDCAAVPPPRPAAEPTVFFAGKLDYRPNVDACEWLVRAILPRVRARVPSVRLVLAGRDPAPAVRRLASARVEVTGPLDDAELARRRGEAWVYAVPLRMGSGVRFKALEAMAAGVPLVATPLGAAGSGAIDGKHALIRAQAASFAGAVADLLAQPDARARLAAAARALAEERHDWRHVAPQLLRAYAHLDEPPAQPVSVIMTLLNERASVAPLLASLAEQTRRPDEVVIVDGGSTDGTLDVLQEYVRPDGGGRVRVQNAPGTNIAQGRNRGIAAAAHETIATTDGGVVLDPEWLARLAAPLARDPRLQAASGFFVPAPQSTWELALGATTLPGVGEIDPARFLPSSRSLAFRRPAWREAGGYPEWLDYCEDLVFDRALRARGAPLRFVPRAVVQFRPRPTPGAFFRQYYRYARGDGKADLWRRRHAVRYVAYLAGGALLWHALVARPRPPSASRPAAAVLLLVGAAGYLGRPFVRLAQQSRSLSECCRAAPLVPVARLTGDVGKMLGYPVGLVWRLRNHVQRSRMAAPGGAIPTPRAAAGQL